MLCSRCKTNPAVCYIEERTGGHITKHALCADCRDAMRMEGELQSFFSPQHSSFFPSDPMNLFASLFGTAERGERQAKRCSLCGLRFADIMESGKVGCPSCYATFKEELSPTIVSIHGAEKHRGRQPKRQDLPQTPVGEPQDAHQAPQETPPTVETDAQVLARLKDELQRAISIEAFERAAELRDQIKLLEKGE